MSFANVILLDHPVIQTKLTELRDFRADHRNFRALLGEIASLMVYEVTRDWPTKTRPVQTPLERTTGNILARQATLVPILPRAWGWPRACCDYYLKLEWDTSAFTAMSEHLSRYRIITSFPPISRPPKFF